MTMGPSGRRAANQKAVFLTCSQLGRRGGGFNSNTQSAFFTLILEIANPLGNNSSVIEHITDTE